MDKVKQNALQVAKEIVVKFVETGRISPTNFSEHFGPIYYEVLRTIMTDTPNSTNASPRSIIDADDNE